MNINTDNYYYAEYYTQQAAKKSRPQTSSSRADQTLTDDELSSLAALFTRRIDNGMNESAAVSEDSDGTSLSTEEDKWKALFGAGNHSLRIHLAAPPAEAEQSGSETNQILGAEELTSFLDKLNEVTGSTLEAEDVLNEYDADGDGALNRTEWMQMMKDILPPPRPEGDFSINAASERSTEFTQETQQGTLEPISKQEKVKELYEIIEEILQKIEAEQNLTTEAETESATESETNLESVKQAFLNQFTRRNDMYEKSFMYINGAGDTSQYGA